MVKEEVERGKKIGKKEVRDERCESTKAER